MMNERFDAFSKSGVRILLVSEFNSIVATTRPQKSPQAEAVGFSLRDQSRFIWLYFDFASLAKNSTTCKARVMPLAKPPSV
jgi:hypothetical protein